MKILYLGPKSDKVHDFLARFGKVKITEERVTPKYISQFDWIVSYGYRHILKKAHIDSSKNPIINLHISFLPFNRGASPNYWSWKNDTPKGVTIHQIDQGIDTGDYYVRSIVSFDKEDNLKSSYKKLKDKIEYQFTMIFSSIIDGSLEATPQEGRGTVQYMKDLPQNPDLEINVPDISDTSLEKIQYNDWELLLKWRNNEAVRNNSKNEEPIEEEQHKEYILDLIKSSDKNQYFYVVNSKKIGYIREDRYKNHKELSYVVSPDQQGKGYGIRMIAKYLEFNKGTFICHIKEDNIASIKAVERNGFHLSDKQNDMLEYKINII